MFETLARRLLPIFPALQDLAWSINNNAHHRYGHSFRFLQSHLTSTLSSVTIEAIPSKRAEQIEFAEALSLLPIHSPGLEEISLVQMQLADAQVLTSALQPLKRLGGLKRSKLSVHANCGNGTEETPAPLGSRLCSQLESLSPAHTLKLSLSIPSTYVRSGSARRPFPSVRVYFGQ